MKIIGITYLGGTAQMVLKGDSSLLNGKKPFFMPDNTADIRALPAIILRVSRLGKHIEERFASRYYDAVAPGLDLIAYDRLQDAQANGLSWTEATCFDYSMPIGEWAEEQAQYEWTIDNQPWAVGELCCTPEQAIARISRLMTIRQGDLIYIAAAQAPTPLRRERVLRAGEGESELLYCKIK